MVSLKEFLLNPEQEHHQRKDNAKRSRISQEQQIAELEALVGNLAERIKRLEGEALTDEELQAADEKAEELFDWMGGNKL
jgi:ribosome recycling factor